MFSAVLFDLGNTIAHLDHAFIAEVVSTHSHPVGAHDVRVAEYRGKVAVDAEFRARRGGTDAIRQLSYFDSVMEALGVAPRHFEAIGAVLRDENARRSLWRVVHDDTAAVLGELRGRGYTLGVVSNADGRVATALAAFGLADHFTAVIDSHVVGVEKPDPRIFQLALDACATTAEESIFVGDIYEIDVIGARRAGLVALLIDPLGLYGAVDCERIDALARLLERLPPRR